MTDVLQNIQKLGFDVLNFFSLFGFSVLKEHPWAEEGENTFGFGK